MSKKQNEEIFYEYEKKKKGKVLPIIIVLIIGFALFVFLQENGMFDDGINDLDSIKGTEAVVNKDFLTGLRLSSLDKHKEALEHFEKMKFDDLTEDDQQIVLKTYIEAGEEQKALNLDENSDEEIIKKLLENDEMEKLKELKTDSELIAFEVAILENDYETIIELKEAPRLEMNERRANAVVNAYYQLDKKEEAIRFASLMADDGINLFSKENEMENSQQNYTLSQSYSNHSNNGILMFFLLLVLILFGLAGFKFFRNKKNDKQAVKKETKKVKQKKKSLFLKKKSSRGVDDKDQKEEPSEKDDQVREKYSYHYDE